MSYALVYEDAVVDLSDTLPDSARRQDTNEWVMGLRSAPVDLQHATGWYAIQDTAQPDETATTTSDRSVEMVERDDGQGGTELWPTVVWTERPKTAAEQATEADQADRDADAQDLRDEIPDLKTDRDAAAVKRDDAALEKAQMTEGDPDFLDRWTPLDGSGTNGERIEALEATVNHLIAGQRQQWGNIRALWGDVRSLYAALIRKLRKDRDDE